MTERAIELVVRGVVDLKGEAQGVFVGVVEKWEGRLLFLPSLRCMRSHSLRAGGSLARLGKTKRGPWNVPHQESMGRPGNTKRLRTPTQPPPCTCISLTSAAFTFNSYILKF